jgi:hypothetical protein
MHSFKAKTHCVFADEAQKTVFSTDVVGLLEEDTNVVLAVLESLCAELSALEGGLLVRGGTKNVISPCTKNPQSPKAVTGARSSILTDDGIRITQLADPADLPLAFL